MRREIQAILLVLMGTALLRISLFSDTYLRYVRAALGPYLTATGVLMVLLGVAGAITAARALTGTHAAGEAAEAYADEHSGHHGHGHAHEHGGHGPRIAWLLTLPVVAIVLVAPPALGTYTARRADSTTVRPAGAQPKFPPLAAGDPLVMTLAEFDVRAIWDTSGPLRGRHVKLTGFATPGKDGGWYLTRLTISCCAADALASKVEIRAAQAPAQGTWVEVVGSWLPEGKAAQEGAIPLLTATQVTRVPEPRDPYE